MAVLTLGWGLLNISLAITVFVISYRNFRIYSERYGSIATGLLLLLTAGMCQSSRKPATKGPDPVFNKVTVSAPRLRGTGYQSYAIPLTDLGLSTITQYITVHPDTESDSAQLTNGVYLTGMVSGLTWAPVYSSVFIDAEQRLQYTTTGTIQWSLLGLPLYTEVKHFSGLVPTRNQKAY